MSYFRLDELKNPNLASLRDEPYRPLQRPQQPIRKPNQKIDVDSCPQKPRSEPSEAHVLEVRHGKRPAHDCHISLVPVQERLRGALAVDSAPDEACGYWKRAPSEYRASTRPYFKELLAQTFVQIFLATYLAASVGRES